MVLSEEKGARLAFGRPGVVDAAVRTRVRVMCICRIFIIFIVVLVENAMPTAYALYAATLPARFGTDRERVK